MSTQKKKIKRKVNNRPTSKAYKKKQREKRMIRIITYVVVAALIVTFILSAVSCKKKNKPVTENPETTTEEAANKDTVKLISVGDIIGHDTILNLAKTDNGYDFTSLFALLKDDISSVDLAIANVETPLGGGPYSGYPVFNTPDEMGLAVIDAGFDVALQASNHSMDSGADGIRHSIDFWKKHKDEILMVGMHESEEAEKDIPVTTVNGIKFSVLNYTYGLNGFELPDGEEYLITVMDDESESFISDQIKRASETSDFVIVCPHWGEENTVGAPNDYQKYWAKLFTEAGADLILGTHPHVIQNIEWITSDNGNKALCYYSLGNFVSNQQYTDTVLGGMAYVEIQKEDGQTSIIENSVIPVVTHNDKTGDPVVIQTYYLADYTQELANVHDTLLSGYNDDFSLENLKQKAANVFGDKIRDRIR